MAHWRDVFALKGDMDACWEIGSREHPGVLFDTVDQFTQATFVNERVPRPVKLGYKIRN